MIEIDCAVESEDWPDTDTLSALAQRALSVVPEHLSEPLLPESEVSLLFTDDSAVQKLNHQWRDKDKPTNVLSFASNEGGGPVTPLLGDIVLARETITSEATAQNKSFEDHLTHLIIHGFLHLLGHDHETEAEAEIMETIEINALHDLGIADPYSS